MKEVEMELARRLEAGEEVVLATVVRAARGAPAESGAKLLLGRAGPIAGTLGCAEFDAMAATAVPDRLAAGSPQIERMEHDLGEIEVYLEPYLAPPLLLVVSATPVSSHLLRWAPELGFGTVLLETRAGRVSGEERARTRVLDSVAELESLTGGDLYAVHTDHDAPLLDEVVEWLLRRTPPPRYIGVMGSRRHTQPRLAALSPELDLARVQTPIGLDLGARTAPEIALSILAGVLAVRGGGSGGWKDGGGRRTD